MASELRKRLGGKLLLWREQEKKWSRSKAGTKAGCDSGTIRRIELGENYKFSAAEDYATALGKPLDEWLWDVLSEMRAQRPQEAQGHQPLGAGFPTATGTDRSERER